MGANLLDMVVLAVDDAVGTCSLAVKRLQMEWSESDRNRSSAVLCDGDASNSVWNG